MKKSEKFANRVVFGDPFWMTPVNELEEQRDVLIYKKNKTKQDKEDLANIDAKLSEHHKVHFNCEYCNDTGIIEIIGDGNKFESDVIGTKPCPHCLEEPLPTQQDLN